MLAGSAIYLITIHGQTEMRAISYHSYFCVAIWEAADEAEDAATPAAKPRGRAGGECPVQRFLLAVPPSLSLRPLDR